MRIIPLTLACLIAAPIAAQQPTFRSGVRLVQTTVIVHDRNGQPVRDLTAADFRILEDGKEQKIEAFSIIARPVPGAPAAPAPAPGAAGVFTNRAINRDDGGVTVVVFDRLNSAFENQAQARDQIIKFLARVRPTDRVALYVLESDTVRVLHDFTTDASRLIAQLFKYTADQDAGLARSQETVPDFMPTGLADIDRETAAWLAETTMMVNEFYLRRRAELTSAALESIADHLAGVPGHKSLVWVSGAFPMVIPTRDGPKIMNREVSRVTRAMNNADVAVYPVDIRGLIGAFANPATVGATFQAGTKPPQPFTTLDTVLPVQDTMRTVAEESGGRVFVNTNAIGDAVGKAMDDSRVSYLIGYYSTRPELDSRFREISVKVNRGGLDVRHRKGYLALPPPAPRDSKSRLAILSRVAQSPLEASAIPVHAQFTNDGAQGSLVVRLDAESLTWALKKDVREGGIDIYIAQSTPDGIVFSIKETSVNLTADAERWAIMLKEGFTLSTAFTVKPDAYRLHVVIGDVPSQAVGSLIIPLRTP